MVENYPLVTIGIPTFNRADKTLSDAIRSARSQDYSNLEIIISDNGSTDNTEQVVQTFRDERIIYLKQAGNIGPNNNYNACLTAAKGSYFLLLHDDDLIDPDFVSTCMEKAGYAKDYGFIRTGTRIIDAQGEHLKDEPNLVNSNDPQEMFSAWVSSKTSFYLCSTLYNTLALKKNGGFKSKNNLFEDGFTIITLAGKYPILNLMDIKSSFRKHSQQRTHGAEVLRWAEDFRIALDMIYLQNPDALKEIYIKGMKKFAFVVINEFARKIENPFRKLFTTIGIGRFFPYYYWPKSDSMSWKLKVARGVSKILFFNKKCLMG